MNKRKPTTKVLATFGIVLLGSLLAITIGIISSSYPSVSRSMSAVAQSPFHYGVTSLTGATLDQVGYYAIEYVQHHFVSHETPQLAFVRSFHEADRVGLGLGCPLVDYKSAEPAKTLVILKGDFEIVKPLGMGAMPLTGLKYVAYIFDNNTAAHTSFMYSRDGSAFRIALNDKSLPKDDANPFATGAVSSCPTPVPDPNDLRWEDLYPNMPTIQPTASVGGATPVPTVVPPGPLPTQVSILDK